MPLLFDRAGRWSALFYRFYHCCPVPELPEVETVRRGLNQVTLHQPLLGGAVLLDRTIATSAADFLAALQGCEIVSWQRRGKYLLAMLHLAAAGSNSPSKALKGQALQADRHLTAANLATLTAADLVPHHFPLGPTIAYLGVHLRMTGQLRWTTQAEPVQKHARVRFFFDAGRELRYIDQRTFGQMWYVPPGQPVESVVTGLQNLGPEPFFGDFSAAYLAQQLQGRQRPIKNALLDQALVAGVGNIYADEALYLSGIHPTTLSATLKPAQLNTLCTHVIAVLKASIAAQGTTFSDFRTVEGINGNYGGQAWVYGRDGSPCNRCGTVIERIKLAGRSAHFCPTCQPLAKRRRPKPA
jgi:formamidopyrimidine-DNA glycosylase